MNNREVRQSFEGRGSTDLQGTDRRGKGGVKPFDGVGKDFANHNKVGLTFVRGLER